MRNHGRSEENSVKTFMKCASVPGEGEFGLLEDNLDIIFQIIQSSGTLQEASWKMGPAENFIPGIIRSYDLTQT